MFFGCLAWPNFASKPGSNQGSNQPWEGWWSPRSVDRCRAVELLGTSASPCSPAFSPAEDQSGGHCGQCVEASLTKSYEFVKMIIAMVNVNHKMGPKLEDSLKVWICLKPTFLDEPSNTVRDLKPPRPVVPLLLHPHFWPRPPLLFYMILCWFNVPSF